MNVNFERAKDGKDEWLTPPEIIKSLGDFDLDPCTPVNRPWDTAKKHYNQIDDGLSQNWVGRIWLNPPYGSETGKWLDKLAAHGDGIALTFARTETEMFFRSVWNKASAILFLKGRIQFIHNSDKKAGSAGAPSCLIAYGWGNIMPLKNSGIKGKFIQLKEEAL